MSIYYKRTDILTLSIFFSSFQIKLKLLLQTCLLLQSQELPETLPSLFSQESKWMVLAPEVIDSIII